MKFCYVDETEMNGITICVGIVVDSQRMHLTKQEWNELLDKISRKAKRPIKEIHTKDLYMGHSPWHGVSGDDRTEIMDEIVKWFIHRKHKVTFAAIDNGLFKAKQVTDGKCKDLPSSWCSAAFHLILGLQRKHRGAEKNKGHTVLIFDQRMQDMEKATALICNPPEWSDRYYEKDENDTQLNVIIDSPYWGDSKNVKLIQIADLIAYILGRYVTLSDPSQKEKYDGETLRIKGWIESIKTTCYPRSIRYPMKGRNDIQEMFYHLAPSALREI